MSYDFYKANAFRREEKEKEKERKKKPMKTYINGERESKVSFFSF